MYAIGKIFKKSSSIGYAIGSVLQFATAETKDYQDPETKKTTQKIELSLLKQPLRLGLYDKTGKCRLSNDEGIFMRDTFQIEFLKNAQYSCVDEDGVINQQTYCSSTLYKSILETLQWVGIYGNSNPENVGDWIQMQLA